MVVQSILPSEKPIFEYFGLEIYLDINDSQPLVFYGRAHNQVSKIVIHLHDGIYSHIEILSIDGFQSLEDKDRENFIKMIDFNLTEIIKFWIDFYVYKKEVPFEKILKPLK